MDTLILLMCGLLVWIFVKNFKDMNVLNTKNIKIIQPPSVYQSPDIDVFNHYAEKSKKSPEQAWESIVRLGAQCQTYEEFMTEKAIDYRLKGILVMLLMEVSDRKKEQKHAVTIR